jgi:membrane protein DedA with SNARE-associated domain
MRALNGLLELRDSLALSSIVAGLTGFESVGLPFPGETVLIVASVIAGTERDLNIVSVILTAGGASIIGRMFGYVIGREYGRSLL